MYVFITSQFLVLEVFNRNKYVIIFLLVTMEKSLDQILFTKPLLKNNSETLLIYIFEVQADNHLKLNRLQHSFNTSRFPELK